MLVRNRNTEREIILPAELHNRKNYATDKRERGSGLERDGPDFVSAPEGVPGVFAD